MAIKRKLKIWFCEDDEGMWGEQKKNILRRLPKASVTHFANAGYAAQSTGSPDYIIVDVGGATALGCDVCQLTKWNVEGLAEKHPGAIFIISSALGFYAEEAFDRLKKEIQAITRFTTDYGMENICDIIKGFE